MIHQYYFIILLLFNAGCESPSQSPSFSKEPSSSHEIFLNNDAAIIENLKKHYGLKPQDMGGGGRCLFHSLREQISENELKNIKSRWPNAIQQKVDLYQTLSADAKADLLREIAIWEEKNFLITNNKKDVLFKDLPKDEQEWALEMAKDWHQEIEGNTAHTREWFKDKVKTKEGREELWQYVINHKDQYWKKTGCETNWAGTAEAISLARALNRPLKMFGRDDASDERGAKLDKEGKVIPYSEYIFGATGKPILVFQTGGGGHYQMLVED
jgi:hypothetical protein